MDIKGGRVTIDLGGTRFSGRAKAMIQPSLVSMKSGINQDGVGWSALDPSLASLDTTFDRGLGLKWDAAMMLKTMNVTFTETDLTPPVTHYFTNARWEGTPSINTQDGEVTGLKIVTDQYQAV